jgi:hypothetical protein
MTEERRCRSCARIFRPRPQNPTQTYCSQPACQRARKRAWQQRKRAEDPDYRVNERAAQCRWAEAHPGYWRQWREVHPEYVERNREAQRQRNAQRRAAVSAGEAEASGIAKGDGWTGETPLSPGTYRLERWQGASDCKRGCVNARNLFVISALEAA